jgi:hypothetical protein
MAQTDFPDGGILWRGWNADTVDIIKERDKPVLLFVADPDPLVFPFLREIFREMPKNARLRALLHETYVALYVEAAALPDELKLPGAGHDYHLAVLSPYGMTPLVTFDVVTGKPADLVAEIVLVLERLLETWR